MQHADSFHVFHIFVFFADKLRFLGQLEPVIYLE